MPPEEWAPGPSRVRPYLGVNGLGASADTTPAGLRPFVLTSGRVDALDPDIGLETQVTARLDGPVRAGVPVANLAPELRTIVLLCTEPVSVAEISAKSRLHLGVTRILVGDLRSAGYLDVHARDAARPDPDTILRVIRGLRAIS